MRTYISVVYVFLIVIMLYGSKDAFAQARASSAVNVSETNTPEVETKSYWVHGSLMFDKKTSNYIREAIRSQDKKNSLEILPPSLFGSTEKPVLLEDKKTDQPSVASELKKIVESSLPIFKSAPSFYLKSIFYFSSDNWSVWLNSKKINNKTDTSQDDISIMDISSSQVIFLWRKSNINRIMPKWKDGFISLGEGKYASPKKDIVVDDATGNISFMLKLNQSLVSSKMEVVEGAANDIDFASAGSKSGKNDSTAKQTDLKPENALQSAVKSSDITQTVPTGQTEGNSPGGADIMKDIVKLKSILNTNVDNLRN